MTLTATTSDALRYGTRSTPDPLQKVLGFWELSMARTTEPGQELTERDRLWPGRLRRIARAHLNRWQLHAFADSFDLLLTELVTNALQHGTGPVDVRIVRTRNRIQLHVMGSPCLRPTVPGCASTELSERGRGLVIVGEVADAWGVSDDGAETWCALDLPKSSIGAR